MSAGVGEADVTVGWFCDGPLARTLGRGRGERGQGELRVAESSSGTKVVRVVKEQLPATACQLASRTRTVQGTLKNGSRKMGSLEL